MDRSVKRKLLYFVCMLVFFAGAFTLYIGVDGPHRSPAAISSSFTWQDIENKQLKQVLAKSEIFKQDESYVLHLGSMADADICSRFQKVKVIFTAEGMAVSGDKPTLHITANCKAHNQLVVLQIPMGEIMQRPPGQVTIDTLTTNGTILKVEHVLGFWPRSWVVSNLLFFNDNNEQKLSFNKQQLKQVALKMSW